MTDKTDERFTVWITKYALTKGIYEVEADSDGCLDNQCRSYEEHREWYHGKDWHRSLSAACLRAEEMRVAKIASHEKALTKLRNTSFA